MFNDSFVGIFNCRLVCGVVRGSLRTWLTSVIVTQCIHGY